MYMYIQTEKEIGKKGKREGGEKRINVAGEEIRKDDLVDHVICLGIWKKLLIHV